MARQYNPQLFFRHVPNRLLEQCLKKLHILSEVDFEKLTETKIDPIYQAWLKLPEDVSRKIERDFREIDFMANEGGTKAIIDEAKWHGEELGKQFSEMKNHHERAFWTFLNRHQYWNQAILYHHADNIAQSYWRKRKNIPKKTANVDPRSIQQLEQSISRYFHIREGRGRNCKVECYRRNELDYFFAYPEDYAQASIEWIKNEFRRRPHHPAFEVIFVYSEINGTLDIFLRGNKKPVAELQKIFAETILKVKLGPDKKDERVYHLNSLKNQDFQFVYDPTSGIEDVRVRKLRLSSKFGKKEKVILEADPSHDRNAVYDLLDRLKKGFPLLQEYHVTQVGLKVFFSPNLSSSRVKTRSFDISFPNSCSLKQDGRDLMIRKMLSGSGLEPKQTETTVE